MMILEMLLGLKSKQGDVTAAFLHGRLEENEEIYLEMPRRFKQEGKCLKLNSTIMDYVNLHEHFGSLWLRKWKAVV